MRFLVLGPAGEMASVRNGEVCAAKRKVSVKMAGRMMSLPVEMPETRVLVGGGIFTMKPWRVFS